MIVGSKKNWGQIFFGSNKILGKKKCGEQHEQQRQQQQQQDLVFSVKLQLK